MTLGDTKDVKFVMPDAWERVDEEFDVHTICEFLYVDVTNVPIR